MASQCHFNYSVIMDKYGKKYLVHTSPTGRNFMFNTKGGLTYVDIKRIGQ